MSKTSTLNQTYFSAPTVFKTIFYHFKSMNSPKLSVYNVGRCIIIKSR